MVKYWHNQKYSECALISIWNTAKYYGLPTPGQYDDEYMKYCKEAHAIDGSAIMSLSTLPYSFGFEKVMGKARIDWIRNNLPVTFSISCHRGQHSVLGVEVKDYKIKLCNYARGRSYWMNIFGLLHTTFWTWRMGEKNNGH